MRKSRIFWWSYWVSEPEWMLPSLWVRYVREKKTPMCVFYFVRFSIQFSSVAQSNLTLRPHESQHARPPCPSPSPRVYSNSYPSSQWCHPAISSSVVPFSSCPQSFAASESFPMSQLFTWGGQSIGVSASASVLPTKIQDWFPLGWTGLHTTYVIYLIFMKIDLLYENCQQVY